MKIRTGFVANSSSSSFILALPGEPKSAEELHIMLFPNGECQLEHPYEDGEWHDSTEVADTVWEDIQGGPATEEAFQAECRTGYREDDPKDEPWNDKDTPKQRRAKWDRDTERFNAHRAKWAEQLRAQYAGKTLYIVEYSDNDGPFPCFMEHGDVFRFVPHTRISKH